MCRRPPPTGCDPGEPHPTGCECIQSVWEASEVKGLLHGIDRGQASIHTIVAQSASSAEQHRDTIQSCISQHASNTSHQISPIGGGIESLSNHLGRVELQLSVMNGGKTVTAVFNGSVAKAAQSLNYVSPHLLELVSDMGAVMQPVVSTDDIRWIELEFQRLLQDAEIARGEELKAARSGHSLSRNWARNKSNCSRRKPVEAVFQRPCGSGTSPRGSGYPETQIADRDNFEMIRTELPLDLPTGKFIITSTKRTSTRNSAQNAHMIRLLFIPQTKLRINGLAATFIRTFDTDPRISPFLSTFGVQPRSSPIFNHIVSGDLSGVREMFNTNKASPTDRDEYGFSLLAVRLLHWPK